MDDDIATLPALRDVLQEHGLWANKGLGQHFLLDLNITARIARIAGDLKAKPVIEVGPGPGGLTRALLSAGADPVIAIEKDARFLPILEELREASHGRLHVVHGDALEADEAALLAAHGAACAKIIANLPYNVGTPLLVKWLHAGPWRGEMILMFQKEVGERIVARAGSDAYGRLAVLAQARCATAMAMTIPARAFTPPPKIASAVVHLRDLADPYPHLDAVEQVTAAAFGQRRKMLRSALKSLTGEPEALLARAGLDPTARAEEIDQAGFRALAEAWRERSPKA